MLNTSTNRTPHRRAFVMALLGVAVAAFALRSLRGVWYVMSITASNLTLPGGYVKTGSVQALDVYNAFSLTRPGTTNSVTGPGTALSSMSGMPTVMVLLIAAAGLVLVSAIVRNSLLALAGAVVANHARGQVEMMRTVVENPNYGGNFMLPGQGMAQFMFATMAMITLCGLVGFQIWSANRADRRARRAAGEDIPSPFEQALSMYGGAVRRGSRYDDANDATKSSTAS